MRKTAVWSATVLLSAPWASASPHVPVPEAALTGGVFSAETLGRGGTIASNDGGPASGSENPATLAAPKSDGMLYSTFLVDTRSGGLTDAQADNADPLRGKTMQYLSVAADKGVLFYEPVSRYHQTQMIDDAAGLSRDVEVNMNALGFAGATPIKKTGSFGLSLAYLFSSTDVTERSGSTLTSNTHATSDGFRINMGVRFVTGPASWGAVIQNAPGLLWGDEFRHQQLPVRLRVGNTTQIGKGQFLSVDGERRFYKEGGDSEDWVYVGEESALGDRFAIRAGAFGTSLNRPETRTFTLGASYIAQSDTRLSYAFEAFELDNQKVKRSVISVTVPFAATAE
jgi:hypothetical protein